MQSKLEHLFLQRWHSFCPESELEWRSQYLFCPGRKFRADFAHIQAQVIVEIQGGTWSGGMGHSRGSGIARDYEKFCLAASLGYLVFPLTSGMLQEARWYKLIGKTISDRIKEKGGNKNK